MFYYTIDSYSYMGNIRDRVYYWSLELVEEGKILQGIFLMLATWNFAYFRYHMIEFNLKKFEKILKECDFDYFENIKFEDANLNNNEIARKIKKIYKSLSDFEGIKYVGATKIMHLMCPDFFVMWDTKIRKEYECSTSPDGYLKFMKTMQSMYKEGKFDKLEKGVSIPRAIDVFNINFTSE